MKQLKIRARAEEAVYVSRQTQEFLCHARSLHRLGEWAAREMMGEHAPGVAAYAEALVRSGILSRNSVDNVALDLRLAGYSDLAHQTSSRFSDYLQEARCQAEL